MFKDKIKKLDCWDISFIKLSVVAFILFVLTVWPTFASWALSINPWYYLALGVVLAIRPAYKAWFK